MPNLILSIIIEILLNTGLLCLTFPELCPELPPVPAPPPPPGSQTCETISVCSDTAGDDCGLLGLGCLTQNLAKKNEEKWRAATPFDIGEYKPRNRYLNTTSNIKAPKKATQDERIVGGTEATPNDYPWAVALIIQGPTFVWSCGGSIISASWVLTAAHCTFGATSFTIQAGAHNILEEETNKIEITSTVAITHEDYNDDTLANDIALIRLPSPLTFNDFIQPICLADFSASTGYRTTAVGWGLTQTGGSISDVLRFVDNLPVISNDDCGLFYGIINDGTLCADTRGKRGTCQGDSGGVLALQDVDSIWVQVGVTSFGSSRGCEREIPVGFARVEFYLDWIKTNTATCS